MNYSEWVQSKWVAGLAMTIMVIGACGVPAPPQGDGDIPPQYVGQHMPEGWWGNDAIIEEGRQLYSGIEKPGVNCARCHGKTGRPVKRGALDFRNTDTMKQYSDSRMLWRIAEGVPYSSMGGFKGNLSEDEIWKIIAFTGTFGLSGLQYDPEKKGWVPIGSRQTG
ncbi:c-type cytochrome [Candidatus Nitrospira salsa]|nr:MAG: hypothetical protein NPIRA01_03160 [Nitrospirales bacterium]